MPKLDMLFVFLLIWSPVYGQEILKVHAKGEAEIAGDISPEKALGKAILDAQVNAIRKAGIPEYISVTTLLDQKDDNMDFSYRFNELSAIEVNANVLIDSIYPEKKSIDAFGNVIVQVEIDARVYKYNKSRDPAFFFEIEGLKNSYYENEDISFSLTPSQDGFLRVFVINDKETYVLYPYTDPESDYLSDKDRLFKKGETVRFPIHPAYQPGYAVELPEETEREDNQLIFVFLKKDIPFIERRINRGNIEKWIYQIPIDQRSVRFERVRLYRL